MLLPQVKARVMRRRAMSQPPMRRRAMSQSLINLLRILLQQIQPRRQLQLLNRQRLILQARHLLIRQPLIPQVRRLLIRQRVILQMRRLLIRQLIHQLIRQPRRQRKRACMINHARSCALY